MYIGTCLERVRSCIYSLTRRNGVSTHRTPPLSWFTAITTRCCYVLLLKVVCVHLLSYYLLECVGLGLCFVQIGLLNASTSVQCVNV